MKRFSRQLHFFKNVGRLGRPDERLGRLIRGLDIAVDRIDQTRNAREHAALQSLAGQVAEESFDHVQPTGAGRREVNVESPMPLEPFENLRMFMRRIIVNDQMKLFVRRRLGVDQLQKLDPLLVPMPGYAGADHLAVERAQGREQRCGSVANVVMRHRRGLSLTQRQARLRAIQRLNLALLVAAQHQRVFGRIQIKADNVVELLDESFVVGELEGFDAMRLEAVLAPDSSDGRSADPFGPGHRVGGPVRGVRRRGLRGAFNDSANFPRQPRRAMTTAPGRVFGNAVDAQIEKPPAPKRDGLPPRFDFSGDLLVLETVAGKENHPRPLGKANANGFGVGNGAKVVLLNVRENNGSGDTHEMVPPISGTRPRRLGSLNYGDVY